MRAVEAGDLTVLEQDFLNLMNILSDFERKFSIRKGFNLFAALNITRQEIRHSRFLAYLLDPNETHGLNDRFLRAILLAVLNENSDARVKRLSVALGDLSDASVYCERDHFDITVQIPALNLLFVIENKVGAAESEFQLETYRKRAAEQALQAFADGPWGTRSPHDRRCLATGLGERHAVLRVPARHQTRDLHDQRHRELEHAIAQDHKDARPLPNG